MATDQNSVGMNGNYAATQMQGYGGLEQAYSGMSMPNNTMSSSDYNGANATNGSNNTNSEIPKDEVGWYFVEQYYTTLSRSPEKLFLFYNKKSQFVSGTEAEKVPVCVGQKSINDRIRELEFQDCKVRVTNVDSQGSGSNIVIQVIGEISNKAAPHRKFTQTFILAEQHNGYFVLNDIFRYLVEDEDMPQEEEVSANVTSGFQEPPATVQADSSVPQTLTSSDSKAEQEHDAGIVDNELQEAIKEEPAIAVAEDAPAAAVNGDANDSSVAAPETNEEAPITEPQETEAPVETTAPPSLQEIEPEKPADPEPTPAASPPKSTATPIETPSAPPKPTGPKTWAMLAAANRAAPVTPAIPATPSAPAAAAQKAPASVQSPPPTNPSSAPAAAAPAATTPAPATEQTEAADSEWQSVGHDHSKKQTRGQAAPAPIENSRGYIKSISDSIDPPTLRSALSKVAEVTYLDINRQKNCAFVDFATPAGYQAAVAANPHEINGERLFVEERRIRPAGGFPSFNGPRGGGPGMRGGGRGGAPTGPSGQGRGGFQGKPGDAGRGGGFGGRGRGGMGPRGRGGAPAAA